MTQPAPPPDFLPIRLGTLRSGETLGFDVYLFIANRYIKHTRLEDPLDPDRLVELKKKGIKKIFIPKVSEPAYLQFLDAGLNGLKSAAGPVAAKAEMAQSALTNIAQDFSAVETAEAYQATSTRVQKINEFLLSEKNMVNEFLKTSGVSQDLAQHSSTVSTLALGLAAKLGLNSEKDLLELSLAALLHDVAKAGTADDWSRTDAEFTPEQRKLHLIHPTAAAETLATKAHVSPRILTMIRDHEEIGNGDGFPEKKRLESLPPLQQVLNLCNHYDRVCAQSKTSPILAGKQFFIDKLGLFSLDMMTALSELMQSR